MKVRDAQRDGKTWEVAEDSVTTGVLNKTKQLKIHATLLTKTTRFNDTLIVQFHSVTVVFAFF